MSNSHFVLVPGAWHRPWHLRLLTAELEAAGLTVSTVDPPSMQGEVPNNHALAADTKAVREVMGNAAACYESIFPVFHSYAALPGADAAAELSDAAKKTIVGLIFLASIVLPQGSSIRPLGLTPLPSMRLPGGWNVLVDPIGMCYNGVESGLAREAAARTLKCSDSAFTAPTQHEGWKLFPSTYISCSEDLTVPKAWTDAQFAALGEEGRAHFKFSTMAGGHNPFLADPAGCARALRETAEEAVGPSRCV